WAAQHTYPLAWPVINCGVSGDTTTQMLARDTAVASATRKALTDLVNAYPDVVILRAGGVNDLLAMTAANTTTDLDAVYSRHIEIVQKSMASGAVVIDEGLYGYSPSSGTAADIAFRQAGIAYLNAKYSAFAATLPGQVYFLDFVGTLTNSDGTYISGVYESSGVHLNDYGQRLAGNMESALLTSIFGDSSTTRFDGVNVITNALMENTGSQSYGTVGTGFTIGSSGAGSVRQNAKIEVIDNKIYQTCEYVWSTASQYGTIYAPFTPATMGISANDVYGFEADIYIENMSGAAIPAPNNNIFSVEIIKTAAGTLAAQMLGAAYTPVSKGSNIYKAHLCVPLTIQEASAAIASGTFYLKWGTDTAGTFKLGMANPRIVKLGIARVTE
ncbi:MAG TPA: SGNH/GDSL hydrolase family protein, partial [Candidatus Paceibacterota bacterium]